ncbi:MAG: VCBS repeat-containing protein [Verrucomicrobia bacterium]|nr:VCBS repeat-containing protein [Verrucomicrobiota bacterium]MBI3869058.1 VCBS repeat-containing protein [Verrucomicrobiota bacterium]
MISGPQRILGSRRAPFASGSLARASRGAWPLALLWALWTFATPELQAASPPTWKVSEAGRWRALEFGRGSRSGFSVVPADASGVRFTNRIRPDRYLTNQIYLNGSGVAAGDVDGDGWCDVFLCSVDGRCALYRNLGDWKFEEIAAKAGVACEGVAATGAAFADLDGDGDLDLIVNSVGQGTRVFLNDGSGRFAEKARINNGRAGMSLALADIDGDGDLDLYVANYRVRSVRDEPNTTFQMMQEEGHPVVVKVNGRPVTEPDLIGRFRVGPDGKVVENGEPDALFLNDGAGGFSPVSFTGGAFLDADGKPLRSPPYDWGLSVMFRDINGDGAPDLYVCNDFESPDRVWINDGHGVFRAIDPMMLRCTSMFSMGVDFADINRDGLDDFFVADMQSRGHVHRHLRVPDLPPSYLDRNANQTRPQYSMNTLFLNRGAGRFGEISMLSGVNASDWSWTPLFLDVDLDGYEDLLITTGHEMEMMNMDVIGEAEQRKGQKQMTPQELLDLRRLFPRMAIPNVAFRNKGNLEFEDMGRAWGFDFVGVSHGMAAADLDNDGDLDLILNNLNDGALLLRNDAQAPRVAVRLKGARGNSRGVGARIQVHGGGMTQSQEMIAGGRYLSSDDPQRSFAAFTDDGAFDIDVRWRSGARTHVSRVAANQAVEISEEKVAPPAPPAAPAASMFKNVSALLNHDHVDKPFDDFQRQPLLPRKLSQLGPGVAWTDVDGDGWEDLVVGGGRGGLLAVLRNEGGKQFSANTNAALQRRVPRDMTGVVGIGNMLFIGVSNYEDAKTNGGCLRVYDLARGVAGDSILGVHFSAGPIAMADVDGDGDLDLFVGGRCLAGRYPLPAASLLLRNDSGRFAPWRRFDNLGLVSGALFTDLDGDGQPELVLACDWGAVRVFTNLKAEPREVTEAWGLGGLTGFWNGVAAGDFNEDGRMDLVVSNWGWNHEPQQHVKTGNRLFYSDFTEDGVITTLEAYYEPEVSKMVPYRNLMSLSRALPFIRERVPSFRQYGESSVADILGDRFSRARELSVATFSAMILLNRTNRFEAIPLPVEAQLAPGFGVSVADADGDGHEDVFIAQNFLGTNPDTPKHAGGLGVWLRGDGRGGFRAWTPVESGVAITGEMRGSAVGDYDGDGRVDLAVGQNSGPTQLLHNETARPGLRVRLEGAAGNPLGIGATLRLEGSGKSGYTREVHAGSGYWSMDAPTQVMTLAGKPERLILRWPGREPQTIELPSQAREIRVGPDGKVIPP